MDGDKALTIDYQAIGRNGNVRLTARFPDGSTHTDKIDAASADERERFLRALVKGRKGIDREALKAEMEKIAAAIVSPSSSDRDDGKKRQSQADKLVELAANAELFHTPGGHDSEGYTTITVDGHKETWPINSKGFKRWLC